MKMFKAYDAPLELRGLFKDFKRMPEEIAKNVSESVLALSRNSAGGRVRFCTNSPKVFIHYVLNGLAEMSHMPLSGCSGIDVYVDGIFAGSIRPGSCSLSEVSDTIRTDGEYHEFEINLPLYNGVSDFEIGIDDDRDIRKARPYKYEKPVVFYGSSITQGACASRPGNCYTAVLARRFDFDHINLGFSGAAKAENVMAEYIVSLDMSVFVYDYDHNAPDAQYLRNTHRPFYEAIRKAHPDLPIIFASRPDFKYEDDSTQRRAVVMETYTAALNAGDKNVYFCDGKSMFGNVERDACTIDRVHPNDLGFRLMADAMDREFRSIFSK